MKKKTNPDFKTDVVLVHTVKDSIVKAVRQPEIVTVGKESFLTGFVIPPEPNHFDKDKRILINLQHIIAITEFNAANEFMGGNNTRSKFKLVTSKTDA